LHDGVDGEDAREAAVRGGLPGQLLDRLDRALVLGARVVARVGDGAHARGARRLAGLRRPDQVLERPVERLERRLAAVA